MKNIPDVKLGIVAGSADWLPYESAVESRKKLAEEYKRIYGKDGIYECPICITDNEVSLKRAMKDIRKAGCNALCIYYANYGPESAGPLFAQEFDGPVMMVAAAEEGEGPFMRERKDALSGFINACYAAGLRKADVYVPPAPVGTLRRCSEMIHDYIPIARTLIAVRELKIISFSPRPSSYLAAYAPSHALYDIGVELSEYSELELLNSYAKHEGDKRIGEIASEMEGELGAGGNKHPEILPKLSQYEVTVKDWVRAHMGDRKRVALTSACWPAFPVNYGFVPCYVNSRVTAQGTPVACESDVFGALSGYVGQCISNDAVAILNINNDIPEPVYEKKIKGRVFQGKAYKRSDLFLGYHCGATCPDKLSSRSMEPHFVNGQLIGEERSQGTIQGQIAPGAVTMFRMQASRDGGLKAYIAQGQVLPVRMETYGGQGIIAVPEFGRFLRRVVIGKGYPNHTAVVFGHYGEQLEGALRQMGIDDIDCNHPEEGPYE